MVSFHSSVGYFVAWTLLLELGSTLVVKNSTGRLLLTDKPQGDTRKYQHIKLSNGLRVLNIQDERALESAFAMAVQSGLYNDPPAFPGLAHFCEHMVFLGTEKFPEPSGFDNFMSANGGSNNAYTASDRTVYFGQINGAAGQEAMDRFADFFRAPLFNRSFVEKEVHAIDSEHSKNIQEPTERILQTFYQTLANHDHPLGQFHTGNLDTLYTAPMKRGENPVDALEVYFKRFYCPDKMRLVTFGPESLDDQFATSEKLFGTIPVGSDECRNSPVNRWATPPPFEGKQGRFLHIQGTQPTPQLWVHFPLPDVSEHWDAKPLSYINYAMSYKGVGSLFRVLTDELGLVTDIGTMADESPSGTQLFVVASLTPKGYELPVHVLDVLFAYLAKMREKGVDEALYKSLANISLLQWDWGEMSDPMDAVEELAAQMIRPELPIERLLSGDGRIDAPDPAVVASLLDGMNPDNANIALVYPPIQDDNSSTVNLLDSHKCNFTGILKLNGMLNLCENGAPKDVDQLPFYNVSYTMTDNYDVALAGRDDAQAQGESLQSKWGTWLRSPKDTKLGPSLKQPRMPQEIKDVPTKIPLDHMHAATKEGNTSLDVGLYGLKPEKLPNNANNLWYRSGWVTRTPKVSMEVIFRPRRIHGDEVSALDELRLDLFDRFLGEEMTPKMVDLVATGVSYQLGVSSDGLSMTFNGFAPLMPRLVTQVLTEFNNFNGNTSITDAKRFKRVVDEIKENLKTYDDMPVKYANSDMSLLLVKGGFSRQESLTALSQVTLGSVPSSVQELMLTRPLEVVSLAMGNLGQKLAESTVSQCVDQVQTPLSKEALQSSAPEGTVELFPPVVDPAQPIELRKLNPRGNDPNDVAVVSLIHGVKTVETRVLLGLVGQILGTEAYNELRTVRQLGYVVQGGASAFSNILSVKVMVQGITLDADEAEAAIEAVITDFVPRKLATLKASELDSMKQALLMELSVPPVGASQEVSHFWAPVKQDGTCFALQDNMVRFLNTDGAVTREKLAKIWAELATPKEGVRKKVTVKYFTDTKPLPKMPTVEQAAAMWDKQGVPKAQQDLLKRELEQSMVLDRADSAARHEILKKGKYFPSTMECGDS